MRKRSVLRRVFVLIVGQPCVRLNGGPVVGGYLVQEVNRGWAWSCTVAGYLGNPKAIAQSQYVIQILDGIGAGRTSPPLHAGIEAKVRLGPDGLKTTIGGSDLTTWRLSQPQQSLPTFRKCSANYVLQTIANQSGIEIVAPDLGFNLHDEDVKQSNWWDPIARVAEVGLCNIVIDEGGKVRLVPYDLKVGTTTFRPTELEWGYKDDQAITGFVVSKKSPHYQSNKPDDRKYTFDSVGHKVQQLRQPISYPVPYDRSDNGRCYSVGFWDGDPGTPYSKLIQYWSLGATDGAFLNVPITGKNPARYMTLDVYPPAPPYDSQPILARVEVSGSTPDEEQAPLDVDLGFNQTVGVISGVGARPGEVREEPLYPSAAWVVSHADDLLAEANKAAHPFTVVGAMNCRAVICSELVAAFDSGLVPAEDQPRGRIERIEDKFDSSGFTTSISAVWEEA